MKKYIFLFLSLLLIIFVTLYSVCSAHTLDIMRECLKDINIPYLLVLFLIIPVYFLLQGLYMKFILGSLNTKISLIKGMYYSMLEFYFSGITPSSTGGQPVQLYFMSKDKIPTNHSTITLLLNTIFFKIVIVILGLWVIIFKTGYIFSHSFLYSFLFILGFTCDILMTTACIFLLFKESAIKGFLKGFVKLFKWFPIYGKKLKALDIDETTRNYKRETNYIKKHKKEVFFTFMLTFIQRVILFSTAYIVYRGMGFSKISYFELLAIQITVQITLEMYPLPGGTIVAETMFRDLFIGVFGIGIAEVGMIFTRMFAFYLPLLLCCVIIVTVLIKNRKKYLN